MSKITYDVFNATFARADDGSITVGGSRQALRADAANVSQVVGEVVTWPTTPVNPDGSFVVHVAKFIEPKEANGFGLDPTVDI